MTENNRKLFNRGFTLIELIVVMAIFLFIIGAAITIFIAIINNERIILSQQKLLNQISYAEEYMSKALRVAKKATTNLDADCLGQENAGFIYLLTRFDPATGFFRGVKFINQNDNDACEEFFLDDQTDPSHPVLKQLHNSSNDISAVALTSKDLKINYIKFGINGQDGSSDGCQDTQQCGASEADSVQPRITIIMSVSIKGDQDGSSRIIQTTVSQRNLNAN